MAPTATVVAESACSPSRYTPQSMLTMLPSASTRLVDGMPCTISSSMDTQSVLGKP